MTSRIFTIILTCLLMSCTRHYIVVNKVSVNRESLASTFVGSPDPRQDNPPVGEKLYVSWLVPDSLFGNYTIQLDVVYRDLSEERSTYPIRSPTGVVSFSLLGEKFTRTKGLYSYKATLLDGEGRAVDSWQHIMWVKIID